MVIQKSRGFSQVVEYIKNLHHISVDEGLPMQYNRFTERETFGAITLIQSLVGVMGVILLFVQFAF